MVRFSIRPWSLLRSVYRGGKLPVREIGDAALELGLVVLDRQDVVGPFAFDQEAGELALGVHRVSGDDLALQLQFVQQRLGVCDLVALVSHLPLGQCNGTLMCHGGEDVPWAPVILPRTP